MADDSTSTPTEAEEDSNVLKDLLGGIRSVLKERLVSPLLPAFTISWLVWNYRFMITILSGENLPVKFATISTIFPDWWARIWDGGLIPLGWALIYIYVYPLFAVPVYKFALDRQRELREARQRADKEKLLSRKDANKILTFAYDQKERLEKQLEKRMLENQQLQAKIDELLRAQTTITNNRPLATEHLPTAQLPPLQQLQLPRENPLTPIAIAILRLLSDHENRGQEWVEAGTIFKALAPQVDITGAKIALNDLAQTYFIQQGAGVNGAQYTLQNDGRKALKAALAGENNDKGT